MSIFAILLLILVILMFTRAIPGSEGDARGLLWTIVLVLIVAWLLMAFASPWGYPTRGWVIW